MFLLKRLWWRFNYNITHLGEFSRAFFAAVLKLFDQIWRTSLGRRMLYALPALAMTIVIIAFATIYLQSTRPNLAQKYEELTLNSLNDENYDVALTTSRRLSSIGDDAPQTRYWRSLAYRGLKDTQRADLLLYSAASLDPDETSSPDAHIRVAERLFNDKPQTAQKILLAEQHLLRAWNGSPNLFETQAALATFYRLSGQHAKAIPILERIAKKRPGTNFSLMLTAELLGMKDETEFYAKASKEHFGAELEANPNNGTVRRQYAESCIRLDEFREALDCYAQGYQLAQTDEERAAYQTLLGNSYARWAAHNDDDLVRHMQLLEEGLKIQANNPALIDQLGQLAQGDKERSKVAIDKLRDLLAKGIAKSQINLLLGIDAAQRGSYEEAQAHLDTALKLNPNMPNIANNLAWVMAQREEADHELALKLAQMAVDSNPNQVRYLDTRGQCYMRLGKYKLALADLQATLPELENDYSTNMALAEVYDKLGAAEMSLKHRQMAKSLRQSANRQ